MTAAHLTRPIRLSADMTTTELASGHCSLRTPDSHQIFSVALHKSPPYLLRLRLRRGSSLARQRAYVIESALAAFNPDRFPFNSLSASSVTTPCAWLHKNAESKTLYVSHTLRCAGRRIQTPLSISCFIYS